MSILKPQINSSSNFPSFFIVMTHDSSVDFRLILFLLWIKGSHLSPNFETFKCSADYLPYSSCPFPNNKSVFLQILHHASVLWKKTPLYFFRPNNKYFAREEQMRVHVLETSSAWVRFHLILAIYETTDQIFFQIFHQSSGSWDITPLYFLAKILYNLRS